MRTNRIKAFCPCCKDTQRFSRVDIDHSLHAFLTLATLGLWGVSWVAVIIGSWVRPWRCKSCGSNEPDFSRRVTVNRPTEEVSREASDPVEPMAVV